MYAGPVVTKMCCTTGSERKCLYAWPVISANIFVTLFVKRASSCAGPAVNKCAGVSFSSICLYGSLWLPTNSFVCQASGFVIFVKTVTGKMIALDVEECDTYDLHDFCEKLPSNAFSSPT